MNRKTLYSVVDVKDTSLEKIATLHPGERVIVGVDVAKKEVVACLYWPDRSFDRPWGVASPGQISLFVELLKELSRDRTLVVAMESSGTYGDVLRQALTDAGIPLQRVSAKAVKDHAETFDGVPSQHDGKDAAVIAELCSLGKGVAWPWKEYAEADQALRFLVRKLDTHQRIKQMYCGKLEALLARHWPEIGDLVKPSAPTLTQALVKWGGPVPLAADAQAAATLKGFGRHYLREAKIARMIQAARTTLGVRMNPWQTRELSEVAGAIVQERRAIARCKRELKKRTPGHDVIQAQKTALGLITACVLWVCLGDVRNYASAGAYRKAMGLNLKERSSGQHKGRLSLSKRGQRLARKWMYFSALRWMRDPAVLAWVQAKKKRDGGKGSKAVIGVMRRLAVAAFCVGKNGEAFDPKRLFPGLRKSRPAAAATGAGNPLEAPMSGA